jgi:hypothetical protein
LRGQKILHRHIFCEGNDVFAGQNDGAEPRVLRPAGPAHLDEPHGPAPRTAQIVGEVDEETVGIVIRSIDDSGQIALRVKRHAAFPLCRHPLHRYVYQYISTGTPLQSNMAANMTVARLCLSRYGREAD